MVFEERLETYHQTNQGLKHPLRCTDAIGPLTLLNTNEYRAEFKVEDNNKTLFWTPCSDVSLPPFRPSSIPSKGRPPTASSLSSSRPD